MSYKRLIVSLLIFSLIIILPGCLGKLIPVAPSVAVLEDTEGILYLKSTSCNPIPGKDFEIELKVSSIEDLKGYSVILSYDPTILKPKEVEEGPCLSKENETFFWKEIDSAKGTIQIDSAILGSEKSAYGDGCSCSVIK